MAGEAIQISTLESPALEAAREKVRQFEKMLPTDQIVHALKALAEEARTAPLAKRFSPDRPIFSAHPPVHTGVSRPQVMGVESEEEMKRWQLAQNFDNIAAEILVLSTTATVAIMDLEAAKVG